MEKWKPVKGYEGLYEVSNCGNVKSLARRDRNNRGVSERILRMAANTSGYNRVILAKDGTRKTCYVHRLVAEAFIPNGNELPMINHIDENKLNNRVENLEWCTAKYNSNYGETGKRIAEALSKAVCQYTPSGAFVAEYCSSQEANRVTGIPQGNISRVINGERRTAGGYIWRKAT